MCLWVHARPTITGRSNFGRIRTDERRDDNGNGGRNRSSRTSQTRGSSGGSRDAGANMLDTLAGIVGLRGHTISFPGPNATDCVYTCPVTLLLHRCVYPRPHHRFAADRGADSTDHLARRTRGSPCVWFVLAQPGGSGLPSERWRAHSPLSYGCNAKVHSVSKSKNDNVLIFDKREIKVFTNLVKLLFSFFYYRTGLISLGNQVPFMCWKKKRFMNE